MLCMCIILTCGRRALAIFFVDCTLMQGDLLNLSATIDDYRVHVGDHRPCNLTSLTDQEMECLFRADFIATTYQVKVGIRHITEVELLDIEVVEITGQPRRDY